MKKIIIMVIIIVIGIFAVFCLYFYKNRNMIFMDRAEYYWEKPKQIAEFPKIIHQTWKTKNLNEAQKKTGH